MESFHSVLRYLVIGFECVSIAILVIGAIKVIVRYLIVEVKEFRKFNIQKIQHLRCELGVYILLALDVLIVKDIIHTVTDISQARLVELGAIIVLRTIIGYFIGKEIEDIEKVRSS